MASSGHWGGGQWENFGSTKTPTSKSCFLDSGLGSLSLNES